MGQDIGRIASRPRWRASPSTRFAVFAVPALIACAGCTPPPAVCTNLQTGETFHGRTIRWIGTDDTAGYQVKDANGLVVTIDSTNSAQWRCRRLM